jgi:hypothetical protein
MLPFLKVGQEIYITFVFFSEEFATCSPTEVPAE